MSNLGITFLTVIGLGVITLALSVITIKFFHIFRRNRVEYSFAFILTAIFFATGHEMCFARGKSFALGMGSNSWVPIAFAVVIILMVVFFTFLFLIRMGRAFVKKTGSRADGNIFNVQDASGNPIANQKSSKGTRSAH